MLFSDKIKIARGATGLTQQQLADAIGVSKRTIAAYETDNVRPRSRHLFRLARALGVSQEYLEKDEVTDPQQGLDREPYLDLARSRYGEDAAREMDELLSRNTALFAGGSLSEEAKDAFFTAIAKAYLACKDEAQKRYSRKAKK